MQTTPLKIQVKKIYSNAILPKKTNPYNSSFYLYSYLYPTESIILDNKPKLIKTGITIKLPKGYNAQIVPRSIGFYKNIGLTLGTLGDSYGNEILNSDYKGEIKVIMYLLNTGSELEIKHGERIAEIIINKTTNLNMIEVDELI